MSPPRPLVAYADGAARGNPGPASFGFVLLTLDGEEVFAEGKAIGRATNNVAEYRGAIAAVRAAVELRATELELRMDSELVVKQVNGEYRVRDPRLQRLFTDLEGVIDRLDAFSITHVPRAENARADALANAALDGTLDRIR